MSKFSFKPGKGFHLLVMILIGGLLIIIQSLTLAPKPSGNATADETVQDDSLIRIRVITAGDAMAHLPQTQAALDAASGEYQYHDVFRWFAPLVKAHDLRIVNLETTLAGAPYKGYPQFSAPDAYARDLRNAGFNLFCTANNHSVDRYNAGILRTIRVLDSLGITHTGIFRDSAHRDSTYPLLLNINGITIAVLNATYGTNGLNPKPPVMVNIIDRSAMQSDIAKAKGRNPDLIMAVMHWGDEYKRFPNEYQKGIAKFLAGQGVDVIVGHHPHVLQPVEWIQKGEDSASGKTLVIWSLGNFYSNQRDRYRDGGMFVNFEITRHKKTGRITIESPGYSPFWVWRSQTPFQYGILPSNLRDSMVSVYSLQPADIRLFDQFSQDTREHIGKNGVVREFQNW
jgi:poly-gamma-glutamate capsule biosynthesis protein CapA/YwtB (metallophosphatase superfamily)